MLLNLYYLAGLNIIRFSIHQLIVRDVPPDLKSDRDALTIALPKDKCGANILAGINIEPQVNLSPL